MWFEEMFDTHWWKYLNEAISKLLPCFVVVCTVLLANFFEITEDMLNDAATHSLSLFLKFFKPSSKKWYKYFKI